MDIGGMCGDSKDSVDIYNEEAIRALMVYQDLRDYFAIDARNVEYAAIMATTVPILCIYPFVQKYFVTGVTLGAVKS